MSGHAQERKGESKHKRNDNSGREFGRRVPEEKSDENAGSEIGTKPRQEFRRCDLEDNSVG